MYTEEEAKTKWCPNVRVSGTDGEWHTNCGTFADVADKRFDTCKASDCMAWRWEMLFVPNADQPPFEWTKEPTDRGYCGAFGKPEGV